MRRLGDENAGLQSRNRRLGTENAQLAVKEGALRRVQLVPGSLLVIERGELHQIRNTGRRPLQTLNLYIPPAYTSEGEVRPAVRSAGRPSTRKSG